MTTPPPVDDASDPAPGRPPVKPQLVARVYPESDPHELTIYEASDSDTMMTRWITVDIEAAIGLESHR